MMIRKLDIQVDFPNLITTWHRQLLTVTHMQWAILQYFLTFSNIDTMFYNLASNRHLRRRRSRPLHLSRNEMVNGESKYTRANVMIKLIDFLSPVHSMVSPQSSQSIQIRRIMIAFDLVCFSRNMKPLIAIKSSHLNPN